MTTYSEAIARLQELLGRTSPKSIKAPELLECLVDAMDAQKSVALNTEAQSLSAAQQALVRANVAAAPVDASASLGLCVNPFFEVSQENGANAVGSDLYPADQWTWSFSGAMVATAQQVADPFSGVAGFRRLRYGMRTTVTTAQAVLGAADALGAATQKIEGTFWRALGWGTADAAAIDVVAVIHASVAGTYSLSLRSGAGDRSYVAALTLNAGVNVVLVTVPGDTAGTWNADNSTAAVLRIYSGLGSNYLTGSPGVWGSAAVFGPTGMINMAATLGATLTVGYINIFPRGVLPWTSASEITGEALQRLLNMRRPFDEEMRRCRRYFDSTYEYGTAIGSATSVGALFNSMEATVYYPLVGKKALDMRSTPAIAIYSALGVASKATVDGVDKNASSSSVSSKSASVLINNQLISANQFAYAHVVANARM